MLLRCERVCARAALCWVCLRVSGYSESKRALTYIAFIIVVLYTLYGVRDSLCLACFKRFIYDPSISLIRGFLTCLFGFFLLNFFFVFIYYFSWFIRKQRNALYINIVVNFYFSNLFMWGWEGEGERQGGFEGRVTHAYLRM